MPEETNKKREITGQNAAVDNQEQPTLLEEVLIEELSIDGICGVY